MKIQLRVHSQIKTNINGTLKQIHAMRERIIFSINDIRTTRYLMQKNEDPCLTLYIKINSK